MASTPDDLLDLDSENPIGQITVTGDQFTNRSLKNLAGLHILSISIEAVQISNPGLLQLAKVKGLRTATLGARCHG